MIRISGAEESLVFACHQPQKICLVAGRSHRGVIPLWKLNQFILFHRISFVDFPILCIQLLDGKALFRLE